MPLIFEIDISVFLGAIKYRLKRWCHWMHHSEVYLTYMFLLSNYLGQQDLYRLFILRQGDLLLLLGEILPQWMPRIPFKSLCSVDHCQIGQSICLKPKTFCVLWASNMHFCFFFFLFFSFSGKNYLWYSCWLGLFAILILFFQVPAMLFVLGTLNTSSTRDTSQSLAFEFSNRKLLQVR